MIYGGSGLARMPAQEGTPGKAVFVPFVLAGEQAEVALEAEKSGFMQGRLEKTLTTSPQRVQPGCPYFQQCGGCQYQHSNYQNQLAIKTEILKENLRRIAKLELNVETQVHSADPWNYRNRTRLKVQASPSFALGYYQYASHRLLAVEQCPISSPAINRVIAQLWELGRSGGVPAGVWEVEIFADADDRELLVEIYSEVSGVPLEKFLTELQRKAPEIAGIVVFSVAKNANPEQGIKVLATTGATSIDYRVGNQSFRVSAGAFFQVNRHLTDELLRIVTEGKSGGLALDLYAGGGLFASALSSSFAQVVAVETSPISFADLRYNSAPNVKAVRSTTEQYLIKAKIKTKTQGERPDYVVVDPPRNGLGDTLVQLIAGLNAPRIAYVSCDPATLARDLRGFVASGYSIEQAHFVDLFPQTYHLESVFHLVR